MIQAQGSDQETSSACRTALTTGGRYANRVRSWLLISVALAVMLGAVSVCKGQVLGWDPGVARSFSYSVTIEHGLKDGRPEFLEHYVLVLNFLGDGRVEITRQGHAPVTFRTTTGGNLRVTNPVDTPPYTAILLLNSLPPAPTKLEPQATWETRFPGDDDLNVEDDKLGLQDRLTSRVREIRGGAAQIDVEGQVRALRNSAAVSIFGDGLAKYESLFRWNFFLTGQAEFAAATKQVKRAEFFYIFEPIPEFTREQLMKHAAREHAVLELMD